MREGRSQRCLALPPAQAPLSAAWKLCCSAVAGRRGRDPARPRPGGWWQVRWDLSEVGSVFAQRRAACPFRAVMSPGPLHPVGLRSLLVPLTWLGLALEHVREGVQGPTRDWEGRNSGLRSVIQGPGVLPAMREARPK